MVLDCEKCKVSEMLLEVIRAQKKLISDLQKEIKELKGAVPDYKKN